MTSTCGIVHRLDDALGHRGGVLRHAGVDGTYHPVELAQAHRLRSRACRPRVCPSRCRAAGGYRRCRARHLPHRLHVPLTSLSTLRPFAIPLPTEWSVIARYCNPRSLAARTITSIGSRPSLQSLWSWRSPRTSETSTRRGMPFIKSSFHFADCPDGVRAECTANLDAACIEISSSENS